MVDRQQNPYILLNENPARLYVIAQACLQDRGNRERALAIVRAAKWAGADAVTFQPSKPGRLTTTPAAVPDPASKLELTVETFSAVQKEAQRLGIDIVSAPMDEESSDFLDKLGIIAFRLASPDLRRRALMEHVARKGKPVLLSVDMNTPEEIEKAVAWVHSQSNEQITLLHAVRSAPAKPAEWSLKSIQDLHRFGSLVGFSDHSPVGLGSIVAASLGARVFERQFAIETRVDLPNQAVPMDAKQLKLHIDELRTIPAMLGPRSRFASQSPAPKVVSQRAATAKRPAAPKTRLAARASAHKK